MVVHQMLSFHERYLKEVQKGWGLRSELEARMVVLLDEAEIVWQYEPCYVELDGGAMYLPDFWLPDLECVLEVKAPNPASVWKTESLARLLGAGLVGCERVVQARPSGLWEWSSSRWAPVVLVNCPVCETTDFVYLENGNGICQCE